MNEITKRTDLNITIFSSDAFGDIRVTGTPEEPLFCLADVCRVLDLRTDNTQKRLRNAPYSIGVIDSMGRPQTALFVTEADLYRVIMRSDKPQAELFQDWVCGEVLPQIRKTGGYIPVSQNDTEESLKAKMEIVYENTLNEMAKRFGGVIEKVAVENKQLREANAVLAEENQAKSQELVYTKSELNQQISDNYRLRSNNKFHEKVNESLREENSSLREENRTYKGLYDKYMNADGWFTATDIAKSLGLTAQSFNKWLRSRGYIMKQSRDWLPTVKFQRVNEKYGGRLYAIITRDYEYNGKTCVRHQLYFGNVLELYLKTKYPDGIPV